MSIQSIGSGIPETARVLSQASQPPLPVAQPAPEAVALGNDTAAVGAVSTTVAAAPSPAAAQPEMSQIVQAVEEMRNAIAPVAQNLQFSIDEDIGRTIVKVVDASTDEVIRQIPSEEIVAIAKAMNKLQGLLIQQEV